MVKTTLRYFGGSLLLTLAAVVGVAVGMGAGALVTTLILIAIEAAFSFDNAIVNAKVLERLSRVWQQLFLTLGMVVAILGMRLVFPIVIVMLSAGLGWGTVVDLALHHPHIYADKLLAAHPAIAAFGGAFLLVLVLQFLFDEKREVLWLARLERPLQHLGRRWWLAGLIAAAAVGLCALVPVNPHAGTTLRAGMLGVGSYLGLDLFIVLLERLSGPSATRQYTGWAALGAFTYLQLLDASFSFDGVLGAFAITSSVVLIAIGLGVGALWVRSLTVFMVRRGTLGSYVYLEHGAHYAILVLAVALLSSVFYDVPDAVTGAAGLGVIVASLIASRQALQARSQD